MKREKNNKENNQQTNEKKSIFSRIAYWISNGLLFIVLLPFNLFKYLNLGFYYILKLMIRETPEKEKQRLEKEKQRQAEIKKEKERAEEYIKEQYSDINLLINAIREYDRVCGQKDELNLSDLLIDG